MTDGATDPCDDCGEPTVDALARVVRLSVDRANIDTQRLCPECFAEWVDRYQTEMAGAPVSDTDDSDSDIIVD